MRYQLVTIIVLSLFLFAPIVYAAGGSTGGGSRSSSPDPVDEPEPEPVQVSEPVQETVDCEALDTYGERISCRLEEGSTEYNTPEACRLSADTAGCVSLYRVAGPCYTKTAVEKDACFRQSAGVEDLSSAGTGAARNYVVFLLYDLQDRIERAYNDGSVTLTEASSLITSIVELKGKLWSDATSADLRADIATFRAEYNEVFS